MSLLQPITLVFLLVVVVVVFFGTEFNLSYLNFIITYHTRGKYWKTTKARGWNGLRFLPPMPPPPRPHLSLSSPLSAPLFKKRSVLLSNYNSKRKNHLEILTCLIALIILIRRLIQSYHIPLICCIQMYLYLLLKAERNWEAILRFDDLLC